MERPEARLSVYDEELRETLEERLRAAGYEGPVGIDAFVYEDDEGALQLRAVSEVNARYTMGRVAYELGKRKPDCRGVSFEIVMKGTAIPEGTFVLNDESKARRFLALVTEL